MGITNSKQHVTSAMFVDVRRLTLVFFLFLASTSHMQGVAHARHTALRRNLSLPATAAATTASQATAQAFKAISGLSHVMFQALEAVAAAPDQDSASGGHDTTANQKKILSRIVLGICFTGSIIGLVVVALSSSHTTGSLYIVASGVVFIAVIMFALYWNVAAQAIPLFVGGSFSYFPQATGEAALAKSDNMFVIGMGMNIVSVAMALITSYLSRFMPPAGFKPTASHFLGFLSTVVVLTGSLLTWRFLTKESSDRAQNQRLRESLQSAVAACLAVVSLIRNEEQTSSLAIFLTTVVFYLSLYKAVQGRGEDPEYQAGLYCVATGMLGLALTILWESMVRTGAAIPVLTPAQPLAS